MVNIKYVSGVIAIIKNNEFINYHTCIFRELYNMYGNYSGLELLQCFRNILNKLYGNNWNLDSYAPNECIFSIIL